MKSRCSFKSHYISKFACLLFAILIIFSFVTLNGCTISVDNSKQENHDLLISYITPRTYNYSIIEESQKCVTMNNIFDSRVYDKNGNTVRFKFINSDVEDSLGTEFKSITMTHEWKKLRKCDNGNFWLSFEAIVSEHTETYYNGIHDGEPYDVREETYRNAQQTVVTNISPFNQFKLHSDKNKEVAHYHSDLTNCDCNLRYVYINSNGKFIATKVVSPFDYTPDIKGFVVNRLELILLDNDEVMLMFYQYNVCTRDEYIQKLYQLLIENDEL